MTETKPKTGTKNSNKVATLSAEELGRVRELTDGYIRLATRGSCANIEESKLQETVNLIYKMSGLGKPKLVVADNMVQYKMFGHIAQKLGFKTVDEKTIYDKNVGMVDDMEKQLYAKLTNDVGSQLWTATKERMETALLTNMLNPINRGITAMNESEKENMQRLFKDACKKFQEQTGKSAKGVEYGLATIEYYYGLAHDSHLPFYEFCMEQGWMDNKEYRACAQAMKNGFLSMLFFDKLAIVCRLPKQVRKNPAGFLHDDQNNYAVTWRDGTGHNFIRGVYFAEDLYHKVIKNEIPAKELLQFKNIEQRYAAIQVYSMDKLIKELGAKKIDRVDRKSHEGRPYFIELYTIEGLIPNRTLKLLRYSDPSTGREYPSFVPDKISTALDGMAFKFGKKSGADYDKVLKAEA